MAYIDSIGEPWNFDRYYHKACGLLGLSAVKRQDHFMHEKVMAILETLKGKTEDQKLANLIQMRRKTGLNELGELLINQMYQEARLAGRIESDEKRQQKIRQDEEREKQKEAELKAAKLEKSATDMVMELQKKIDTEKARVNELLATNGGQYATA